MAALADGQAASRTFFRERYLKRILPGSGAVWRGGRREETDPKNLLTIDHSSRPTRRSCRATVLYGRRSVAINGVAFTNPLGW